MQASNCIFCCHHFAADVRAALETEGLSQDVSVQAFAPHCGRPALQWQTLQAMLPPDTPHALVLGSACVNALGEPPAGVTTLQVLSHAQCFHLVAPTWLVDEAVAAGSYLITPGWLAHWPERLVDLGFSPSDAGGFFSEFAKDLLLFDTGTDPQAQSHLADMAAALGLPAKRYAVGLAHLRASLASTVLQWRLDDQTCQAQVQQREHAKALADHVCAMEMLSRLAQTATEDSAVVVIQELFEMLFAPAVFHYVRVQHQRWVPGVDLPADLLAALQNLQSGWCWSPSGQGFCLQIVHDEQLLGLIALDQLAFAQYRDRYLNLALSLVGICALAIDNARNRKRLVETEKMASLGTLVAGVAHEINTPLGVGLTAASALQIQSEQLGQRFAQRLMTQSDLQGFLTTAQAEAGLISSNLTRIGQLVETFRQIAIDNKPQTPQRFCLCACLQDVLASLAEPLAAKHIRCHVVCDTALEITSFAADWTSILTNLITNSLRHGFKGRDSGNIHIQFERMSNEWVLSYADDGVGLTAEACLHVFDPF